MKSSEETQLALVRDCLARARAAVRPLSALGANNKKRILAGMADGIIASESTILAANNEDVRDALAMNLYSALVDRLTLDHSRLRGMSEGIRQIAELRDPVGEVLQSVERPNGLIIRKTRVPFGVVAIIYESRPNVTADAAALCLKSSNAAVLRSGKEAVRSARAIVAAMTDGGSKVGLPSGAVQLLEAEGHDGVRLLVEQEDLLDLAVPRGGENLIRAVARHARVPVVKHYKGVCHVYVDRAADVAMAMEIALNAKCQRPGVCNAMETLLVDRSIAATFVPAMAGAFSRAGVELRGDEVCRALAPGILAASASDWSEEYLDLILAVKTVDGVEEAIAHINHYGSHHSDAIVTLDPNAAEMFSREVDSAAVYVNASTRFTDGAEFGMGAEIGISTDKLHARGPMGIEELTTYKYIVTGTGQTRR